MEYRNVNENDTLQDSLDKTGEIAAQPASRRRLRVGSRQRRNYRPGDQISYYVKATPKKAPAYEAAKLASSSITKRDEKSSSYDIVNRRSCGL